MAREGRRGRGEAVEGVGQSMTEEAEEAGADRRCWTWVAEEVVAEGHRLGLEEAGLRGWLVVVVAEAEDRRPAS